MLFFLVSCDYFKQDTIKEVVARVNDSYLYHEDIKALISEDTSKEDSTLIVDNYINRWATQQLLLEKAQINLPPNQLEEYAKLVDQYKFDLITEAYKSVIVNKQVDSIVSSQELQEYYEANKENFRLNDELLKIRYIDLPSNQSNLAVTKQKFYRFNNEDSNELSGLTIQYKSFNFNDSTWIKKDAILEELPRLISKENQLLKKSNNIEIQDSLGVYLVHVKDVLKTNDVAPFEFIAPTLKQIIIKKRKLDLIKKLEKDITKDAIKNKDFETY